MGTYWGSWFRDASPLTTGPHSENWSNKIWVSLHYRGSTLLEYNSYEDFRQDSFSNSCYTAAGGMGARRIFFQGWANS